jgi:hypothetical protein
MGWVRSPRARARRVKTPDPKAAQLRLIIPRAMSTEERRPSALPRSRPGKGRPGNELHQLREQGLADIHCGLQAETSQPGPASNSSRHHSFSPGKPQNSWRSWSHLLADSSVFGYSWLAAGYLLMCDAIWLFGRRSEWLGACFVVGSVLIAIHAITLIAG